MENSPFFSDAEVNTLCRMMAHRRSLGVARLRPDPVERPVVERVLEAANWAPSHGDTEPWRFVVFTGESRRALGQAFAEAYRQQAEPGGDFKESTFQAQLGRGWDAPVWISIGLVPQLRPDGTLKMSLEEELMAVACAVQNLHLVASAQGLAGMWLSKGVFVHPSVAEFVGLTQPYSRLLGFFVLGWSAVAWPAGERRPLSEKVRWAEDEASSKE